MQAVILFTGQIIQNTKLGLFKIKKKQLQIREIITFLKGEILNKTSKAVYTFVSAPETLKPRSTVVIWHPFNIVPKREVEKSIYLQPKKVPSNLSFISSLCI